MGGDSRKNSTLLGSASQNTKYKNSGEEVLLKIQNMPPCSLCSPTDHNPNMCSSEQRKLEMTFGGFPLKLLSGFRRPHIWQMPQQLIRKVSSPTFPFWCRV